ncbi:cyanophycinase [Undibacterium sp.]|uniref:cyanophycinase n=1 Tax=Undibacterium sp. TaxID=1914977 RepID=UPI0037530A7D
MKINLLFISASILILSACGGGGGGGGADTPSSPVTTNLACILPAGVDLGKVGNVTPKKSVTSGGTVLMGGNKDVDEAIKWMINKSGGGDFVVIRATGGNGYNSYINSFGGVNSVQTLLIDNLINANNACVVETIKNASALFIAGGNQADYINFYKGQGVGSAINYLINVKKAPIGGTSAGMAIMAQYYHPGGAPEDQSVLQAPTLVALGDNFLNNSLLLHTVVEPHFTQGTTGVVGTVSSPKRPPRLTAFMAKMLFSYTENWQQIRGISADNDTAVAIDENGLAKIFVYAGRNGNVNFVKPTAAPELLAAGTPLTWNAAGKALEVYEVPGTVAGTNTFNLTNWTGTGGRLSYWSVNAGVLSMN